MTYQVAYKPAGSDVWVLPEERYQNEADALAALAQFAQAHGPTMVRLYVPVPTVCEVTARIHPGMTRTWERMKAELEPADA
jgi:hypothetical protein